MKKILAVIIFAAGIIFAAVPFESEAAAPVGVFRCTNCGATVQIKYDYKTNKIPNPGEVGYAKGCKRSANGEHNWRAMRVKM